MTTPAARAALPAIPLADLADTQDLARRLAGLARAGDVLALEGDLGAGKTTFARAFIAALAGGPVEVPSPTFTLVQTYPLATATVWHFDLYRLERPDEAFELDIEDAFAEGISLIEWPERLGPHLPADRLLLRLRIDADGSRSVTVEAGGDWGARLARAAQPPPRGQVIERFLQAHGWAEAERRPLAGDASFRRYERLCRQGEPLVLMDAPPPHEDVRPFLAVGRHLVDCGYSAPRVIAADVEHGLLLLEDLGDDLYSRVLQQGGDETLLYGAAVDLLADLHRRPPPADRPPYDLPRLLAEAELFTEWYLPALDGRPAGDGAAYRRLWQSALPLAETARPVLVLRDYHADNLLWLPERAGLGRVGLLDFQDAVAGPPAYDLVSLLEDARRDVPPALAEAMLARYLTRTEAEPAAFAASYAVLGAQRNAKIIGIFTRLWRRDGKPQYLRFLPRVWGLLERDLAHPALADLRRWFDRAAPPERRRQPLPGA